MTTENDDIVDRELAFGKAQVNNEGVPEDGFVDPELKYPKSDYKYQSSINRSARGEEVRDLLIKNAIPGKDLGIIQHVGSEYPLAQIDESTSGHIIEINDTPGGERILLLHNTGAGIEMKPDGTIIINALNNRVDIVSANYRLSVEGEGDITYFGNLNMTVTGDYTLDVKGDYKVKVGGSKILEIVGSYRKKIAGVMSEIIQKSKSSTVLQQVTNTYLNGLNTFTKGIFRNHVDGEANYLHSGQTTITSEVGVDISTENMNIAAQSISVFGDTGTIGGENIIMYSKNSYVGEHVSAKNVSASSSMKSKTFHGDLNGTAKGAEKAGTAKIGPSWGNTVSPVTHRPDTTATAKPTEDIMTSYLNESNKGIREVKIDPDDSIFNSIDLSVETGNVTNREITPREVRSKLKDQGHLKNEKFIQSQIGKNTLSPEYSKSSPSQLGRIRGEQSTVTTGTVPLGTGNGVTNLKRYKPIQSANKSKSKTLLPPSEYNPQNKSDITMETKLGDGLPISKFVSAYADATTLQHITSLDERKQIARNLYAQSDVFRIFYSLFQFKGYNLVVAEGLYKPAPKEENEPGGLKDLAKTGNVVAYELYNKAGKIDLEKTYDFAVYLKDNIGYDKLALHYDKFDPNSSDLNGQIVIVMPTIPENFSVVFKMNIETVYNGNVQATNDLIEILA
jgi:hypothetical protein